MTTNKKRWLLTIGIVLATSIPAAKMLGSHTAASDADHKLDPSSISNKDEAKDEAAQAMQSALYKQVEFFNTTALVAYPTATARNQLLEVIKHYPKNPFIQKQLAELETELGNKDLAEKAMLKYVVLSQNSQTSLEALAEFYQEQAEFQKQVDTLNKIMDVADDDQRGKLLQDIISLADKYKLEKYSSASFYKETLTRYPDNLIILKQYIDKLVEDKKYQDALKIVTSYRQNSPDIDYYFLEKQADILEEMNRWQEAKALYIKAFDPFWPDNVKEAFYYKVLSRHEQLRSYGQELRRDFQRDPSNFDLAMRLLSYCKYHSENDLAPYVFYKLEEARSKNNAGWEPKELATLARFSLQRGEAERASRYIYTLYNQGHLSPSSELRGQILYQLFELVSDAQSNRLPLTTGNLKFYENIATADPHPGVIGGILSLIFSDSNPREQFTGAENTAIHYFNQAAAYRIFLAYKKEYPTSPQLAQMYLDIIRFYTRQGNTKIADETLIDFEKRYKNSEQFAEVAMKLADVYILNKDRDKELAVYQQVLDYLGKTAKVGQLLTTTRHHKAKRHHSYNNDDESEENTNNNNSLIVDPTETKPTTKFESLNDGIKATQEAPNNNEYYYNNSENFADYLGEIQSIDYVTVLNRYIFTLNQDNRTKDIIDLFNREIKKHPKEQALYEQLLQWLGQTNLVEDQLAVYQKALKEFPSTLWYDRMARWLIKQKRQEEFAAYSRELLSKFDDEQISTYLSQFISDNYNEFNSNLYLSLYTYAHNRFPQNRSFVQGLLSYYVNHKQLDKWQALVGRYYFIWPEIRETYLSYLAKNDNLRKYLSEARKKLVDNSETSNLLPYKLFRADAAIWLCNYEEAIDAYRELNQLYPGNSTFAEQLVKLTRSFGQIQDKFLTEATNVQLKQSSLHPGSVEDRVTAGELYAEMNDYQRAKAEWLGVLDLGKDKQTYLDTATVLWDYYQYDDALRVIEKLRGQEQDNALLAFEMGAILEAKHQTNLAVREYIKGITESNEQHSQARRRLVTLYERDGLSTEISKAFSEYRGKAKDQDAFILAYVDVLERLHKPEEASKILKQAIYQTKSTKFLEEARNFFIKQSDQDSQIKAINQCIKYNLSSREDIRYRLELISVYRKGKNKKQAIQLLGQLYAKYPFSYGVINEVVSNYWNMGLTSRSVGLLRQAQERSRGKFYFEFSRRLAARESDLNHTKSAESILQKLFAKDKLNRQVLEDLTKLYIRTENQKGLEETLNEGLKAIESQDIDVQDLRYEVASFRGEMIKKFTQISDYTAAIKQHIEIINRNPEDDSKITAAIQYTEKYGGGDELADYYQKVFQQAYKNYRWAVVLARIYTAKGDLDSAVKYYKAAIDNQPEKAELYKSLAESYEKKQDLESAITAMNKAIELSNHEVNYVNQGVRLLELAKRSSEATVLRAKLPLTEIPKAETTANTSTQEGFAQAEQLRRDGDKEAIKRYREAFESFYNDPYKAEYTSTYELQNYAETVHKEDSLIQILESFWKLRDKLIKETTNANTYNAGKARALLEMLNGALPGIIGRLAQNTSTGDELSALHQDLIDRVKQQVAKPNGQNTLLILENIALGANFVDLSEYILEAQKNGKYQNNGYSYADYLDKLVSFYETHANYEKALSLVETEFSQTKKFSYLSQAIKFASLVGDNTKELQLLRKYYHENQPNPVPSNDANVERYLTLLYEGSNDARKELSQLTTEHSVYHMQLVNFLIAKKEVALAHKAISNSPLSKIWKDSRNAELSIKQLDYNPINNQYFENILKLQNIGQMIKTKPRVDEQLIGDNWFEMAYGYGEWLYNVPTASRTITAEALLPAMLERRPKDGFQHQKLGEWYLQQNQLDKALAELLNAEQQGVMSAQLLADIGSIYFLKGDKDKALNSWEKILTQGQTDRNEIWLTTLKKYGLADKARNELVKHLEDTSDRSDTITNYVHLLASSFKEGDQLTANQSEAQAEFFIKLCKETQNILVTETIIKEQLIAKNKLAPLYEIMIQHSEKINSDSYDYDYRNYAQITKDINLLEAKLDNSNFQPKEPSSSQYTWQKEYLQLLLSQHKDKEASKLIAEIEKPLAGHFMRPEWLRLANIKLLLHNGNFDQAWKTLLYYTKIDTYKEVKDINLPKPERLQQALNLLDETNFGKEKDKLLQAYYERSLALEQYTLSNITGLASVAYRTGNSDLANNLLQIALEFTNPEAQSRTAKKLANLPIIKACATTVKYVITPETSYQIYEPTTSQAIAELAAINGQYNLAIERRKYIKQIYRSDETNRLELARLLAANNQSNEAVTELLDLISNVNINRKNRWLAFSLIPNIANKNAELWAMTEKITDREFKLALQASRLASQGEYSKAIRLIDNQFNSVEMKFFQATLERKNNQPRRAIALLGEIAMEYDLFDPTQETSVLRSMVYLYSAVNSPQAVLALAEKDSNLQLYLRNRDYYSSSETPLTGLEEFIQSTSKSNLQPLKVLQQKQQYQTTLDLLALAANAAESLGKTELAVNYLKALKNESSTEAQAKIQNRITKLEENRKLQPNHNIWQVDTSLLSR